jgi:flagella basal body P-ring formation protein FlgA
MTIFSYILALLLFVEVTFDKADIKELLDNYIIAKGRFKKENVIISYFNIPEKVTVKSASAKLSVSEISRENLSGNVTIPVNIVDNGKILKKIFVSVKINIFDSVFVSRQNISQYQIFDQNNIEKKWMEITGHETPARLESEIFGKRANRYISEGKLITLNIIENPPIIKSGQQITIISRVNSVVISAGGVAREDGRKGEIIVIENSSSGAKLKGKVIDKERVEIIR